MNRKYYIPIITFSIKLELLKLSNLLLTDCMNLFIDLFREIINLFAIQGF